MINKIALLVFAFLALSVIGCKNQIEDKHTAYLDSIILKMEASQEAANAINMQKLAKMGEVYDGYLSYFRAEYDSIENGKELLPEFEKLTICTIKFKKVQSELPLWQEELHESIEKLEALRHDYSNKLISEDELKTFLGTEMAMIDEVNREYDEHIPGAINCFQNFKTFTDKPDSIRLAHINAHE